MKRPLLVALAFLGASVPVRAQELTLLDALDSARVHHPALGRAAAGRDEARAGVRATRAAYLPSVSLSGQATRFQEPMVVAPFHGFDLTSPPAFDRTLIQGRLSVGYTIFDGGARRGRLRGAEAMRDAAEEGASEAEAALTESVVTAFARLHTARAVLDAARRQERALAAERTRADRHFSEGTAARVDVLRAEAAHRDAASRLATAEASVAAATAFLARLMGVSPELVRGRALGALPAADVGGAGLPPSDTAALPPTPELRAAAHRLAAAEARLDAERASRLPSLQGSAGLVNYGDASGGFVTEWQAGVGVAWPLFTGGARSAAIDRAAAEVRRAREDLRLLRLERDNALDAARTAVVEAAARARALEASVAQWEEVARIEALRLDTGVGTQTDYLRAEARLFEARAGLAAARGDAAAARARLARAEGTLTRTWLSGAVENER